MEDKFISEILALITLPAFPHCGFRFWAGLRLRAGMTNPHPNPYSL